MAIWPLVHWPDSEKEHAHARGELPFTPLMRRFQDSDGSEGLTPRRRCGAGSRRDDRVLEGGGHRFRLQHPPRRRKPADVVDALLRRRQFAGGRCAASSRGAGGATTRADGKASGRVGVALATSGPGASDIVAPIADAILDSVRTMFITGQVRTDLIGTEQLPGGRRDGRHDADHRACLPGAGPAPDPARDPRGILHVARAADGALARCSSRTVPQDLLRAPTSRTTRAEAQERSTCPVTRTSPRATRSGSRSPRRRSPTRGRAVVCAGGVDGDASGGARRGLTTERRLSDGLHADPAGSGCRPAHDQWLGCSACRETGRPTMRSTTRT